MHLTLSVGDLNVKIGKRRLANRIKIIEKPQEMSKIVKWIEMSRRSTEFSRNVNSDNGIIYDRKHNYLRDLQH